MAITLKDTHPILLQEPTMATDPVCLMIVDEDEAKFTSTVQRANVLLLLQLVQKEV